MNDSFDVLRAHLRKVADDASSGTDIDELIAQITLEHHRDSAASPAGSVRSFTSASVHRRRPRRRWGSVVVAGALCVGVGAGAVVTAAVIDRARVSNPQVGVLCHASVADPSSVMVVPADDDPVAACAALWRAGALPVVGEVSAPTDPPLVQCTGSLGLIQVFPGVGDEVCTGLGMAVADVPGLADVPLYQLGLRISTEINARCLSPDEAQKVARSLLDEFGFESWTVVLQEVEGLRNGCSLGVAGSEDDHALYVNFTPTSG